MTTLYESRRRSSEYAIGFGSVTHINVVSEAERGYVARYHTFQTWCDVLEPSTGLTTEILCEENYWHLSPDTV